MDITYRRATLEDLEEIDTLVQQAIVSMEQCNINQWDDLYPISEDFQQDIEKKQLFVGIVKNEIAVIYVLNQEYDEAYENGEWGYTDTSFYIIHRLCVKPSFQNCGLAKMTMAHIEKEIKSWGGQSIRLDVFTENPYALKLYKGCGYDIVGHTHWRKGRFYLMEKGL